MSESSNRQINELAATWIMRLTADDAHERQQAQHGFAEWKASDIRHAEAAARIEQLIERMQSIRQENNEDVRPAHAALHAVAAKRKSGRSRTFIRTFVLAMAIGVPSWFALDAPPPSQLLADLRTSEGQWLTRTLEDGTRITLSGSSAVNVQFNADSRTLVLLEGDIRVDVAKDAARPFIVQTPLARIRALGTRFAVSHGGDRTVLNMFESRVLVQTADEQKRGPTAGTVIAAGQRVEFQPQGIERIASMDAPRVEESLQQHRLVVQDQPLPEVLRQLSRYRPGRLQYDSKALAHLRVSGVLPLDHPDQALQLLQANFPELRMRSFTSRLVWIDVKPASNQNSKPESEPKLKAPQSS
ncbi:FecR domain-containing protein [uncultured Oxalicibacterium sp.]|uniref:FecR family protein n=1 Tax=uncultured Oxalicibacterium sp. TaxID=1168540 RepID=UPI0025D02AAF|nr:FecR domain-containing protein [uncultured Oxalicibacterium sp.]